MKRIILLFPFLLCATSAQKEAPLLKSQLFSINELSKRLKDNEDQHKQIQQAMNEIITEACSNLLKVDEKDLSGCAITGDGKITWQEKGAPIPLQDKK